MRKTRFYLHAAIALVITVSCLGGYAVAKVYKNPVDCYALLVVAAHDTNTTLHKNLDPIDKNGAELALCRIYKTLIDSGYEDKNVIVLYWDGRLQPNWSEKECSKYFKRLRKNHFKRGAKPATVQAVQAAVNHFKGKVDDNDQFVFYIVCHGAANGKLMLNRSKFPCSQIQQTFSGFKSKSILLMFDSCYSGKIIDLVEIPNAVIYTTTSSRAPGWVDRTFSNCVNFIECKADKKFDKNKDGFVDYQEAYDGAKNIAIKYEPKWRDYLKTKYRPPKPTPKRIIDSTSLMPTMEVGDDFEKFVLGPPKGGKPVVKPPKTKKPKRDRGEKLFKRAASYEKKKKYVKAVEYYKKVERLGKRTAFSADAAAKVKELLADDKIAAKYEKSMFKKKLDSDLRMAESYFPAGYYKKVIFTARRSSRPRRNQSRPKRPGGSCSRQKKSFNSILTGAHFRGGYEKTL